MIEFTINDATIASASLYKSVTSVLLRWDLLPFAVIYVAIITYATLIRDAASSAVSSASWTEVCLYMSVLFNTYNLCN